MKKLSLLFAALVCSLGVFAQCQDGPYAVAVNGTVAASFVEAGISPDGISQLNAVVSLEAGDAIEFVNTSCDARWFPQNIETGGDVDGSGNFTIEAGTKAVCNVAGCYNLWWKKVENNDRVYIGTDGDCSGNNQGGNQGGNEGGNEGGNTGDCQDGPYAVAVNGTVAASFVEAGLSPDGIPQLNVVVSLEAGDAIEFVNTSCDARWFPQNIETGGDVDGSGNFTIEVGTKAVCNVAGCYNLWWKKVENDDRVYIGTDGDCSGNGGNQGGNEGGNTGDCQDGPYAVAVNGTVAASFVEAGLSPDGIPQLNVVVSLTEGDAIEFVNTSCDARWFPQNIETGGDVDGSGNFTIEAGTKAVCNVAGCYNLWWKKVENDDRVYIGTDGDCSGGNQGGNQGGGTGITGDFYLIGHWNGQDFGDGDQYAQFIEAYKFTDCKWSGTLTTDNGEAYGWIRAKMMLNGGEGWMFYSAYQWQGDGLKSITLYSSKYMAEQGMDGQSERWSVPTNQKLNITLTVVNDHEIRLDLVDDATFAAHNCGEDVNPPVNPPADGDKLYIIGRTALTQYTWDPTIGAEMTYDAEKQVYTVTTHIAEDGADGTEAGYFSFTTKLGDWDTVNANRFAPMEADQEIVLGETTPMQKGVDGSFKIAAGNYTITVDVNALTLVVVAAGDENPEKPDTPPTDDPKPSPDGEFYLVGYIEGADYGMGEEDEYKAYPFVNGVCEINFSQEAYVYVRSGDVHYMTASWMGMDPVSVVLRPSEIGDGSDKMHISSSVSKLYLYTGDNEGELILSTVPMKNTALETVVRELDLNAPMYNILGQRVDESFRGIVIQNGQKFLR